MKLNTQHMKIKLDITDGPYSMAHGAIAEEMC